MLGVLCSRPKDGKKVSVDADGNKRLEDRFTLGIGYRWLPSHRHFVGTVEQKQRAILGTEIVNHTHIMDFSLTYDLTKRITLNTSIPVIKSYRNQLYAPTAEFRVFSQGDATFGFRAWLFRPPSESRRNIGIGLSLKTPTGRFRVAQDAVRAGQTLRATADQSIQPGDGGTGFVADVNAYSPTYLNSWLFFQGTYLFNPRNTNGVSTFRTRRYENVFSVADQYLVRGGLTRTIPKLRRMAFSIGMRMEGVPVRDLLGRSDGFRRPGYSLAVDPGWMAAVGKYSFSVSVPVAVRRDRKRSVTDYLNNFHGDAGFADYSIIAGVTRRF